MGRKQSNQTNKLLGRRFLIYCGDLWFLFHIFPGYVKFHQIYGSHLFLFGIYTLNSCIYVKINQNWHFHN